MNRREIKQQAKDLMKGKVFILFVILFIMSAISGPLSGLPMPILMFGFYLIVQDMIAGKEIDYNRFADPFKDINHALKLVVIGLLVGLITLLGLILFIVPGIVLGLMYSQAVYIAMDDKEISISDALKKSKEMMAGHKTELFVFYLSFIGHYLLFMVTFGLWVIYFAPFLSISVTNYYLHLKALNPVNVVEVEVIATKVEDEKVVDENVDETTEEKPE